MEKGHRKYYASFGDSFILLIKNIISIWMKDEPVNVINICTKIIQQNLFNNHFWLVNKHVCYQRF